MPKDAAYQLAEQKIAAALTSRATKLDLHNMQLTELPESIGQLTQLTSLNLSSNKLTALPDSLALAQLTQLTELNLSNNQLTTLPDSLGQLARLTSLDLSSNQLTTLPDSLGQLTQLTNLNLSSNQLTTLPDSLGQLTQLTELNLSKNQLTTLPESFGRLKQLTELGLQNNQFTTLPESLGQLVHLAELLIFGNKLTNLPNTFVNLSNLQVLRMGGNPFSENINTIEWRSFRNLKEIQIYGLGLKEIPVWIYDLKNLEILDIEDNQISDCSNLPMSNPNLKMLIIGKFFTSNGNPIRAIPYNINQLTRLEYLFFSNCQLTDLPPSLAQFEHLTTLELDDNPLNPALQSAYNACERGKNYEPLFAYLRSLEQNAEPLYEAKLVLVGEGNVGKTTLLKALKGKKGKKAPKKGETTTHGVEIDIHGLLLPHPSKKKVKIQLNAWDFGGQDVYRVTHQFFFSRRSLYLLVWEPRNNVQQGRLDEWLDMIRLRVGDEARVIIVSTHCKSGGHLARIDKPVFKERYGNKIVDFCEVDSLVPDEATGEMVGITELKKVIAEESAKLEQMGMGFNNNWKAARDELLAREEPRISYSTFAETCAKHSLSEIDTSTLAHLMHDLGYIVHYSDDENLRDDVVLKPQWLTKAIGFVLEDRATAEREGILPDGELYKVWHDHAFPNEPRYDPEIYPFFLRLMEKYDVCYRLSDGKASLVAQHVPQVRPELPWLPEQDAPKNLRRIAMVCAMEEDPPGLVPWMIVRTHDYSVEQDNHHLHWQKGMFLNHGTHGQAMLEKRGREFHVYTQADWPEYFMNVLQHTLQKIITDNWPGMEGRYRFAVPCPEIIDGQPCKGRFNIHSLRQFLAEGDSTTRCPECTKKQSIVELLFGFEERTLDAKLAELQSQIAQVQNQIAGLDSRVADYFMATMRAIADEAKHAPRLFIFTGMDKKWSIEQIFSKPMKLQLWCEAEGCQHPVEKEEPGKGIYTIEQPQEWVAQIAPYANFALNVLKIVSPIAAPAINTFFGSNTTELWGIKDQLELADAVIDQLPDKLKPSDRNLSAGQLLSESERSGMLALHRLLEKLDPTQANTGLHRVNTYTGDYRWLCKRHYDAYQPNIPDVIPTPNH